MNVFVDIEFSSIWIDHIFNSIVNVEKYKKKFVFLSQRHDDLIQFNWYSIHKLLYCDCFIIVNFDDEFLVARKISICSELNLDLF